VRVFVITKRTLIIAVIVAVLLIAGILVAVFTGGDQTVKTSAGALEEYELEVLAGRHKELPVYSVERPDKKIALTIDAAWEDDKTPFILSELDKEDIKATFFICGFWLDKYPDHVKEIFANGHELGNHTSTHPHMNKLDAAGIQKELSSFDDRMEKLTGRRTTVFRAPFGEYNDLVIKTARSMGYTPVQWDIDTIDWKEDRSAETILNAVIPKLHPGAIILCHNNGYKIEEYLPRLITAAKEKGYEFVTVSDLMLPGSTIIDVNGVMKPGGPTPLPSAAPTMNVVLPTPSVPNAGATPAPAATPRPTSTKR